MKMMHVRRKQLSQSGRSEIPAPAPPPPHPGYAPDAAIHAIKRHALEFVNPKELQVSTKPFRQIYPVVGKLTFCFHVTEKTWCDCCCRTGQTSSRAGKSGLICLFFTFSFFSMVVITVWLFTVFIFLGMSSIILLLFRIVLFWRFVWFFCDVSIEKLSFFFCLLTG